MPLIIKLNTPTHTKIYIYLYIYQPTNNIAHFVNTLSNTHRAYTERCWAIRSKRGIANLGSSFGSKESLSLLVDLINACNHDGIPLKLKQLKLQDVRMFKVILIISQLNPQQIRQSSYLYMLLNDAHHQREGKKNLKYPNQLK